MERNSNPDTSQEDVLRPGGIHILGLEHDLLRLWRDPLMIHELLNRQELDKSLLGAIPRSSEIIWVEQLRFLPDLSGEYDAVASTYAETGLFSTSGAAEVFLPSPEDCLEAILVNSSRASALSEVRRFKKPLGLYGAWVSVVAVLAISGILLA